MIKIGSGELLRNIAGLLKPNFGNEANSLAMILLEDHFRLSTTDILQNSEISLSVEGKAKLDHLLSFLDANPIEKVDKAFQEKYKAALLKYLKLSKSE